MLTRTIKISPENLDAALKEAAAVLKAGGLVAYPTESFYAIGADALNPDAVEKVFLAKKRREDNPLPVIIHDKAHIYKYARDLSPVAVKAIEKLMPGPLTLVLWASATVPEILSAGTGKVGIRVPEHAVAAGIARLFGGPVTATSANHSGMPGLTDADSVAEAMGESLGLILDGGRAPGAPASTVLDVTSAPALLIREGLVKKSIIEEVLGHIAAHPQKTENS